MKSRKIWLWSVGTILLTCCHSVACFQSVKRLHSPGICGKLFLSAQITSLHNENQELFELKEEFRKLARRTSRGFKASVMERSEAKSLISRLSRWNPTTEPGASYYERRTWNKQHSPGATLDGKWNLIYTDAPDITSLADNPLADLGRIGQECSPPLIKNVIEWKRPNWASSLPFSGSETSRVIQKVVTEGKARPEYPSIVNLFAKGVEIDASGLIDSPLAALIRANPVSNLQGSFALPFGQFEVLYLDHNLRVVRTGQGYYAANARISLGDGEEEWF